MRLACNRCTHPLSSAMQEEERLRGMGDLGYWIHLDPDPPFLIEDSESWVKGPGFRITNSDPGSEAETEEEKTCIREEKTLDPVLLDATIKGLPPSGAGLPQP